MKQLQFSVPITDKSVAVRVILLEHAIFIWVGDSTEFVNLNVSASHKFSKVPSSVELMGSQTNEMMSQKLCKRFNKQVLLSYNLVNDGTEQSLVDDLILKSM